MPKPRESPEPGLLCRGLGIDFAPPQCAEISQTNNSLLQAGSVTLPPSIDRDGLRDSLLRSPDNPVCMLLRPEIQSPGALSRYERIIRHAAPPCRSHG